MVLVYQKILYMSILILYIISQEIDLLSEQSIQKYGLYTKKTLKTIDFYTSLYYNMIIKNVEVAMDKILSIRRNNQISSLLFHIQALQKSANRTAIVNAAITRALSKNVNWKELANTTFPAIPFDATDMPDFIQLRVNANDYELIAKQVHDQFFLEKMPPAPFVIKLVLTNYLVLLSEVNTATPVFTHDKSSLPKKVMTPEEFQSLPSVEEKLNHLYYLLYTLKKCNE